MSFRFSIVMPVYNREKYLRQAIDSVLSQTFADYELIAVDDGSTDSSVAILKTYGNRIRVILQKNSGPEVARNAGAAAAQGEYIALLDSDDFYFPTTLETYDRVIRAFDSPAVIVGSEFHYRDGTPAPASPPSASPVEVLKFKDILSKDVSLSFMGSLYVIRKSVYEEIGGFRNSDAQTWWGDTVNFVMRLAASGPFILIRKPYTAAYRMHEGNSVKSARLHAEGYLKITRAERDGQYPGGRKRRWERYALLGGVAGQWAVDYCWRVGERKTAIRLLWNTAPMVFAAVVNKFLRRFRKPTPIIVLPPEKCAAESAFAGSAQERNGAGEAGA